MMGSGIGLDLGNLLVHLKMDDVQFVRSMKNATAVMQSAATKLTSIGTKLSLGITAPLAAIGFTAVRSFMKLEDAFIGVQKTVNATDKQLALLKKGFDEMSKTIPIASSELYGIGEAAGQLGIETKNILSFTKIMGMLGVTTNLSSQEAATSLARLANITGMSQNDFDKLGATIVDLGNKFSTTEAKIVSMGMRLAGAGHQIGLSEHQILGFATALSSLGIEAEAGGTAWSRVFLEMNKAVAVGGKELKTFASIAGMSGKAFQQTFKQDASAALVAFVEGLSRARESGTNLTAVLEEMGLGGMRVLDVLGRMSGASEKVNQALQTAEKAWKENIALVNEAQKRFASLSSQWVLMKNRLLLLSASIGEMLVPYLKDLNAVVIGLTEYWDRLNAPTKQWLVHIAIVSASIGPLLLGMGGLLKVITMMGAPLVALIVSFAKLIAVTAPLIAVFVGIAAIAYTFRAAWIQNFDVVKDRMKGFIDMMQDALKQLVDGPIGQFVKAFVENFFAGFNSIRAGFKDFMVDMYANTKAIIGFMQKFKERKWDILASRGAGDLVNQIKIAGKEAADAWAAAYVDAVESGDAAANKASTFVATKFEQTTIKLKELGADTSKHLQELGNVLKVQFKEDIDSLVNYLKKASPELADMLEKIKPNLDIKITGLEEMDQLSKSMETANQKVEDMKTGTMSFWERLDELMSNFVERYNQNLQHLTEKWQEWRNNTSSILEQGLMQMFQDFSTWKEQIKQIFKEIYLEAVRIALIKPAAEASAGALSNVGSMLAGYLGGGGGSNYYNTQGGGSIGSGYSGSYNSSTYGPQMVPVGHTGLIAGQLASMYRMVNPSIFDNAQRLHTGSGIKRDEQAVIMKKGEWAIPENQVTRGGQGGGTEVNLHFDGQQQVVTKQEEYMMSDKRILDVWLTAAGNNRAVRNTMQQVART